MSDEKVFRAEHLDEASNSDLLRLYMLFRGLANSIDHCIGQCMQETHMEDPATWFKRIKNEFIVCLEAKYDINAEAERRAEGNPSDNALIAIRRVHIEETTAPGGAQG
jgi:hypothetical protein